jgi:hypothetical protein
VSALCPKNRPARWARNQAAEGPRRDHIITIWFTVRVLLGPPRIRALTEISPFSAISPELAGLFSEDLSLRRHP